MDYRTAFADGQTQGHMDGAITILLAAIRAGAIAPSTAYAVLRDYYGRDIAGELLATLAEQAKTTD